MRHRRCVGGLWAKACIAAVSLSGQGIAHSDRADGESLSKQLVNILVQPPLPPAAVAEASIVSCDERRISGALYLVEHKSDEGVKTVDVLMFIAGLADGKHAVHIHETGVCEPCSAAQGHFDPGPAGNSSPDGNHPYHAGDLVNVDVNNGIGMLRTITTRITVTDGPLSVFDKNGSAVIVHAEADSYCPGGEAAGCAGGPRVACGVITPF